MLMFLCPVHFFSCRPPMTSSDLLPIETRKLNTKVDLPEIKGNHRKFRNLVTSYIGNSVYVCVHLSIFVRVYVHLFSHNPLPVYMSLLMNDPFFMLCSLIFQCVDLSHLLFLRNFALSR